MLLPPATALAPWQPGLWITQTGYALTPADVAAGTKQGSKRRADMYDTMKETTQIMEKVMSK